MTKLSDDLKNLIVMQYEDGASVGHLASIHCLGRTDIRAVLREAGCNITDKRGDRCSNHEPEYVPTPEEIETEAEKIRDRGHFSVVTGRWMPKWSKRERRKRLRYIVHRVEVTVVSVPGSERRGNRREALV